MAGGSLELREYPGELVRLCQVRALGPIQKKDLIEKYGPIFNCRICGRRSKYAAAMVTGMTAAWFAMSI